MSLSLEIQKSSFNVIQIEMSNKPATIIDKKTGKEVRKYGKITRQELNTRFKMREAVLFTQKNKKVLIIPVDDTGGKKFVLTNGLTYYVEDTGGK